MKKEKVQTYAVICLDPWLDPAETMMGKPSSGGCEESSTVSI